MGFWELWEQLDLLTYQWQQQRDTKCNKRDRIKRRNHSYEQELP